MSELCENENCTNPQAGYPCKLCGKNTCVSCDTYYYVTNEETGEYTTDPNEIMEIDSLDGNVAHADCVSFLEVVKSADIEQPR